MLINHGFAGCANVARALAHDSNKNNGLQVRQYPPHTPPRSIGAPGNAPMRANAYKRTSAHIGALAQNGDRGSFLAVPYHGGQTRGKALERGEFHR
jgi:hypothetical protein